MQLHLGIDGGGTKTEAAILDADGRCVGVGMGGPCNIATLGDDKLRGAIETAVAAAVTAADLHAAPRFVSVGAGIAGYTARKRREEFQCLLPHIVPATRHIIAPDFEAAWWGATGGEPGVAVIAGTGAVVYGCDPAGDCVRRDGRGFLLGDRGSGLQIGREALRRVVARWDAGEALTPFDTRVLEAIGAIDADDVIEYVYRGFQPGRVAALAALVGALASEGDAVARAIVTDAADALAATTREALTQLRFEGDVPLYLLGGLWQIAPLLREVYLERICLRGHDGDAAIDLRSAKHTPAHGAALLAMAAR